MRRDMEILEKRRGEAPPALRLQLVRRRSLWAVPKAPEVADLAACRRLGIDGSAPHRGRAVLRPGAGLVIPGDRDPYLREWCRPLLYQPGLAGCFRQPMGLKEAQPGT